MVALHKYVNQLQMCSQMSRYQLCCYTYMTPNPFSVQGKLRGIECVGFQFFGQLSLYFEGCLSMYFPGGHWNV